MKKWKYTVKCYDGHYLEGWLDEMGQYGWEFCGWYNGLTVAAGIFKRPLSEYTDESGK